MATIEFGDFACTEFGGFTDHTSAIPSNPESCSIFPETGSVKSFNSALAQSFDFKQKGVTLPDNESLHKKSIEQEGKFVFNSLIEQGFSQNQIAKLSGMRVYQEFITHLSLTDEGLSNMQNLSIPSLTSLSFFAEKTNSFELELSVAKDFPNNSKEESSEVETSNFLLDLSLPIKEVKSEEPTRGLNLDEDLLSLNFGGLDVMEERVESNPISRDTSIGDSKKLDSSVELEKIQISKETEAIIQSLPDLSYLMSRVLVFPLDKKLSV